MGYKRELKKALKYGKIRASEGNRTPDSSLGSWGNAILRRSLGRNFAPRIYTIAARAVKVGRAVRAVHLEGDLGGFLPRNLLVEDGQDEVTSVRNYIGNGKRASGVLHRQDVPFV